MNSIKDIPDYLLSQYQEELIQKLINIIDSKSSDFSYVATGPRMSGTKDALTIMLAILLVTRPNFHVTVLCPYRNIGERLADLTYHWLVQMQKNDEVRKSKTNIWKDTSGVFFTCAQDIVLKSWSPEVLIITEAEYIPPSSIAHLFLPTTSATKVIVMNNTIGNIMYIDELWTSARKDK